MMEYRGYVARIEFDHEDEILHGRVINTRAVIGFHGKSVREVKEEFQKSIDSYLEICGKRGKEPEKPFSGNLHLRLGAELHRAVTKCAIRAGISTNSWIVEQLSECASEKTAFSQTRARKAVEHRSSAIRKS